MCFKNLIKRICILVKDDEMIKKLKLIIMIILISSCSTNPSSTNISSKEKTPGLFTKDSKKGISLSDILNPDRDSNSSVNINGYLWRATLNVLSFMPLISSDAFGGVIVTDWYVKKNIKDKRMKITAYIKTSELRSNGIEVKVHVQKLIDNVWSDTVIDNNLASKIENNILSEARNLRVNASK
tara:strand:- start:1857 stop:2405 length:549 start_codon:yes stop_codon:yes gene_type:complete